MNTHMWLHPMTQRNVEIITQSGRFSWQMPVEKRLACGDFGVGGLAEPSLILHNAVRSSVHHDTDTIGRGYPCRFMASLV